MMRQKNERAVLSLVVIAVLALGALAPAAVDAAAKKITIAVVRDGPTEMNEIVSQIRPELIHLVGADYDVTFDMSDEYDAGWDPQRIRPVIESAMRNPKVDIVMGIGFLVNYEAARPDLALSKPFVGATLLDGDLPKLDFGDDRKLKDNLCLVVQPQRTDSEVDLVNRLLKTRRIHLVFTQEYLDAIPEIRTALDAYGREIGVEIVTVPVSTDWRPALEALGANVEIVFFEHTTRLSRAERAAFVEALNERSIPTFSGDGPEDLEIGMLATNRQDVTRSLTRRVALNLFQLLTGYTTGDLPVLLIADSQLTINGRTAAKIGFPISFEAMVLGTVLHPEALEADADSLDMNEVLAMADTGNVQLSISNQEVNTALRGKQVVRSPMFPQVGAGAAYNNYDNAFIGTLLPEQFAQFNLRLSQMVFDDELISNFRSSGREYDAAMFQNQSDRLDVYLNAEAAYLRYVQTRLMYRIALSNLRLTEGNLEIARMRVEVGHSGRDEVFRWTAELNQQRTFVLDIESVMETQRIELNRILGVDLGKRWRPEPMDENADWFVLMREKLGFALETQANFNRFTEVAVEIAFENSPERKFLQMNIEAEAIQLGQRKRSFIVPKVSLDLDYNYNFWQSPDVPEMGDYFYEFRVTAALPLFEGTRRVYDMQLSKSLIVELEERLRLADQFVEQRARNSLRQLQASLPNIEYSQVAAENARRNFEVVRDKYANGIVNITDLISAQTASFAADQDALVSLYTFLLDSADFQRAVSFFPDTKSGAEVDEFVRHVREKMAEVEDR
jgi:outer membrane protein TolC